MRGTVLATVCGMAALVASPGCGRHDELSSREWSQVQAQMAASGPAPVSVTSADGAVGGAPAAGAAAEVSGQAVLPAAVTRELPQEDLPGIVEYRFTGVILSTEALPAHRGQVLSVHRDANFAVVVHVLRQLDGQVPMDSGNRLALGIHSLVQSFPPEMFPLKDRLLEFTILRHRGRMTRELKVAAVAGSEQ